MKSTPANWEELFDEQFVQFENGVPVGGYEQAPYKRIKSFISTTIAQAKQEAREEERKRLGEFHGHQMNELEERWRQKYRRLQYEYNNLKDQLPKEKENE